MRTFSLVNSVRGVILSTQVLLVLIALLLVNFQPDNIDMVLIGLELLAFALTIFTLRLRSGKTDPGTPTEEN